MWWSGRGGIEARSAPLAGRAEAFFLKGSLKEEIMQYFQTPDMKALGLPFSAAVRVGDVLYLSGAIGNVPGTLRLADGGMAGQARQALENIGAVLHFCGLDFADVVKCTVMLADMSEWSEFNAIYATYFTPDRLPARSAFGCNGLALGAKLELECLARYL
jgi:reactive intermediate/imine deaminase